MKQRNCQQDRDRDPSRSRRRLCGRLPRAPVRGRRSPLFPLLDNANPTRIPGRRGARDSRLAGFLLGSLLLLALIPGRAAAASDSPSSSRWGPPVRVTHIDDGYEVEARDARLGELLAELEGQCGLSVRLDGQLGDTTRVSFEPTPLPQALRRVLRGHNYVLRYSPTRRRAGELWIYAGEHLAAPSSDPPRNASPRQLRPSVASRRQNVLAAIEDPEGSRALDLLTRAARGDEDPEVRLEAVYSLGELGDGAAVGTLEEALGDVDPRVRQEAVAALADIGGDAAAWAIQPALAGDDAELRVEAALALGEIGGDAAVVLLRQTLADDEGSVREAAAEMLDELDAPP